MRLPYKLDRITTIDAMADGTFAVFVNGVQWGPAGSKADASGAYPDTWPTPEAARAAWQYEYHRRPLSDIIDAARQAQEATHRDDEVRGR